MSRKASDNLMVVGSLPLLAVCRKHAEPNVEVHPGGGSGSITGSKSAKNRGVAYAVQTAANSGSDLLIFVPRAAHSHDLPV
jgi:hypothetical protein